MTVAVTGASGHVGAALVRALLERGVGVRALARVDVRGLEGLDVELVRGDVLDRDSLAPLFDGVEAAYHLSSVISLGGDRGGHMRRVNVEGTRNVVSSCLERGVGRLVHFSSIHALSPHPLDEVVDETRCLCGDDGRPAFAYDRSKAEGEKEVLDGVSRGLDAVIVNPTAVLGPHDHKVSLLGAGLLAMLKRRLPMLVQGGFDWVDSRDVALGAIAAMERGRSGERYLLTGEWRSVVDLARTLEEVSGVPVPRRVCPAWLARASAPFAVLWGSLTRTRPLFTSSYLETLGCYRRVSGDKARRELDHRSRPLAETLADAVAWYRDAKMV